MADSKRVLERLDQIRSFGETNPLQILVEQLTKDLQVTIVLANPEEIISQVKAHIEESVVSNTLLPVLYRVDLKESVALDLTNREDWTGLAMAILEREVSKIASRYSTRP